MPLAPGRGDSKEADAAPLVDSQFDGIRPARDGGDQSSLVGGVPDESAVGRDHASIAGDDRPGDGVVLPDGPILIPSRRGERDDVALAHGSIARGDRDLDRD